MKNKICFRFLLPLLTSFFFLYAQAYAETPAAKTPDNSASQKLPAAEDKPNADSKKADPVLVKFETTLGNLVIELDMENAPISATNFIEYVTAGFYNGVIFHRIIPGFVVQGGGFDTNYRKKPTRKPIINESNNGLKNLRGTLSMARTMNPNSATAQFFINLVDNSTLDWQPNRPGYAVFGKLKEGLKVIDKMAEQEQGNHRGPFVNAPNEAIVINKAYLISSPQDATNTDEKPQKEAAAK